MAVEAERVLEEADAAALSSTRSGPDQHKLLAQFEMHVGKFVFDKYTKDELKHGPKKPKTLEQLLGSFQDALLAPNGTFGAPPADAAVGGEADTSPAVPRAAQYDAEGRLTTACSLAMKGVQKHVVVKKMMPRRALGVGCEGSPGSCLTSSWGV